MPNTYAYKGVSNPNVPIFPPRVCTLVLFIIHILRDFKKITVGHRPHAPHSALTTCIIILHALAPALCYEYCY